MIRWNVSLLGLVLLGATGCRQAAHPPENAGQAQPPVKVAPQTPLAEKKEDLGADNPWSPALDAYIEKNLPPDLLSAQAASAVRSVCPAFAAESDVDKRAFWAYTLQAMSAAEAGLKPTADVHHTQAAVAKTDTVTHRPIRQEGLLQLTYEDADRYGCGFNWAADSRLPEKDPRRTILDPQNNLQCGMKILDNQIITQGKPLLVHSSYWSTLRPGTESYRVFSKQMANVPPACGRRPQRSPGNGRR